MTKALGIHNLDARELDNVLAKNSVSVTITSPPYFDLKNYGHPNQIGYGQTYEEYLLELETVFTKVHNVTKNDGSLWVIIDMFKRDGEVIPLPFDFVSRIKGVGWKLQEVIIWEKDRTVPWTKNGQMRNSFEYILMFSKTDDYKFRIERVKTTDSLKKWWIRYPERYHPKGKSPEAIWHFPIPTQGSWGKGYIRHFCPLPEDLIAQIVNIASDEKDLIMDPFAGSGAVLSRAANMKRKYVGFELNSEYIRMFDDYLASTGDAKRAVYEQSKDLHRSQDKFAELIINLRALKFVRLIYQHLTKNTTHKVFRVFVPKVRSSSAMKHKITKIEYHFLMEGSDEETIRTTILDIVDKPPLSKFGIEGVFVFHQNVGSFLDTIGDKPLYLYTTRNTHAFKKKFQRKDLAAGKADEVIISEIKLQVDESLYE